MPYPKKIIKEFSEQCGLTDLQQKQLHESLMTEGLQKLIESKDFDPKNLLIQLNLQGEPYVSVLSSIATKEIIDNPDWFESLRKSAEENPEALKQWDNIKAAIEEINHLPRSRTRQRKQMAQEQFSRLLSLEKFIKSHQIFIDEHFELSRNLLQYMNAMIEPIHEAASNYFSAFFEGAGKHVINIDFSNKKSGVQLGATMTITYEEQGSKVSENTEGLEETSPDNTDNVEIRMARRIAYFIKTHQHGSTSERSSIKPVDPKELFVYKVLEYIGYGPKTHFFFNQLSAGGFFIATQDLGFTKICNKKKTFTLFANLMKKYNETPENPAHDGARRNLICLDILSRILRLHDTTTNPGNFGVVTVERVRDKWKFLDFRVVEDSDMYLNPRIFEGFQRGNGVFNYDYAEFLRVIFREPANEIKKMELGKHIMEELKCGRPAHTGEVRKMSLLEAIKTAYEEICKYMVENSEALRLDWGAASADLHHYFTAIKENLHTCKESMRDLKNWRKRLTSSKTHVFDVEAS